MKKVIYKCNICNEPAMFVQDLDNSVELIYKDRALQRFSNEALSKMHNAFSLDEIMHFIVHNEIYLDEQKKEFAAMAGKM